MADQLFSVKSGFYNAVSGDRTYTADDMNKPYKRLVADGVFAANDGTASSDLQAVASGTALRITVQAGQAIVAGKWFENPTAIIIDVPANTALYGRIDSVIMRVDNRQAARAGSIIYRTGEASSSPSAPALDTTSGVTEYRLANIAVASGATAITGANVTDLRGSSSCPWVTGLIQQVDTSTLWAQFQAAYAAQYAQYSVDYDAYVAQQRQDWAEFIQTLTSELNVTMNMIELTSVHTATESETTISIGIGEYDPTTDILEVYINGLKADPTEYTKTSTTVTLNTALDAGGTVLFRVLKAVIGGDLTSVVSLLQRVEEFIDGATPITTSEITDIVNAIA